MRVFTKERFLSAVLMVCFTFLVVDMFAQERELRIEEDGFRWYWIKQDGHEGAETGDGVTIIPLSRGYDMIYYISFSGKFKVFIHHKYGICDKEGKEIIKPIYDFIMDLKTGDLEYYSVKLGEKRGICDKDGKEIFPPKKYDDVWYHKDENFECYKVTLKGRSGLCDKDGKEIIKPKYDVNSVNYNSTDGYITARLDGKMGAFDREGKVIVKPKYESLRYSSKNDCFEYKDKDGNWVSLGISLINGDPLQIDAQGRKLHVLSNGYKWYEIESNGHYGALNVNGDTIVPLCKALDSIVYVNNEGGWFAVLKNGKVGVY